MVKDGGSAIRRRGRPLLRGCAPTCRRAGEGNRKMPPDDDIHQGAGPEAPIPCGRPAGLAAFGRPQGPARGCQSPATLSRVWLERDDCAGSAGGCPRGPHEVAVVETLAGRHARTLKHGDTFSLFDASGDIRPGSADGLYHLDTRHLSRFDLTINGVRPILLSSTLRDDNAALTCDLTNPELPGPEGGIHSDTLHIRRTQFLWEATLHERLRIRNFGSRSAGCASRSGSRPTSPTSSRSAAVPGRSGEDPADPDRGCGRHLRIPRARRQGARDEHPLRAGAGRSRGGSGGVRGRARRG
jgi:hypothetical protein